MSTQADFDPELAPLYGITYEGYFEGMPDFALCYNVLVSIQSDVRYFKSVINKILEDPDRFDTEDREAIKSTHHKMEEFLESIKVLYRDIRRLPDPYDLASDSNINERFNVMYQEFQEQSIVGRLILYYFLHRLERSREHDADFAACCRLYPPAAPARAGDKSLGGLKACWERDGQAI
ncbi:hypothetical protein GQX73_g3700 [Xylaria multiplex]|uniref:Uncharacterized protein n=1 Tax=Xylaria multiplex TaxID=323545 RepID=A0A7C8IQP8_9PEZI|nr:hypothetical protein GQX73_g3700 [Xylaria multiplex]